jgi:hypothetical protein
MGAGVAPIDPFVVASRSREPPGDEAQELRDMQHIGVVGVRQTNRDIDYDGAIDPFGIVES